MLTAIVTLPHSKYLREVFLNLFQTLFPQLKMEIIIIPFIKFSVTLVLQLQKSLWNATCIHSIQLLFDLIKLLSWFCKLSLFNLTISLYNPPSHSWARFIPGLFIHNSSSTLPTSLKIYSSPLCCSCLPMIEVTFPYSSVLPCIPCGSNWIVQSTYNVLLALFAYYLILLIEV